MAQRVEPALGQRLGRREFVEKLTGLGLAAPAFMPVSYTHLRAHETTE